MKRVWITRTEPGASQLGSYLAESGYSPLVAPVVKIQAIDGSPPIGLIDCWTFLSVHAVQSAVDLGWTSKGICAVIGPATERALRPCTESALVPDKHTSEGLFALLRNTLAPGARICLVTGENGRRDLEDWLSNVGFEVIQWTVYRRMRQPVSVTVSELDVVVAGSAFALPVILDTLELLHLPSHKHPSLVVPSERIARDARELGFHDVQISDGASKSAVLDALERLN